MSTMTSDSGSQATSNSMPESERKYFQIRSMYSSTLSLYVSTRQFLRGQGCCIRTYRCVRMYIMAVGRVSKYVFCTYVHTYIHMEHEGPSHGLVWCHAVHSVCLMEVVTGENVQKQLFWAIYIRMCVPLYIRTFTIAGRY